ncbi:MAG: ABC transporter permease, partial [Actinomycetota bacterium]|nr:ABC transporter permease [Actinomycetota bacterium]
DALSLLGVEPVARFLARTAVGAVLLAGIQAALALVSIVLYDPPLLGWPWLIVLIPLVALGIAALGSLTSALTARTRGRAVLAPLLLVPLALPLVVAATQVIEGAVYRQSAAPWLLLAFALDLVLLSSGIATAPWVEEESSP